MGKITAHIEEGQANAELEKEREEATLQAQNAVKNPLTNDVISIEEQARAKTDGLDAEKICARIKMHAQHDEEMSTIIPTQNFQEIKITAQNEEKNTSKYDEGYHNEQAYAEYPTRVVEERDDGTKC